jgi:hypothetical protein
LILLFGIISIEINASIINFDIDEEEYLNKHILALNGLLD